MPTAILRPLVDRVLDPATKEPLPAGGRRVELCSYWRRRIRAGEVEIVEEPERPKRAPKRAEKE